jgi:hypothetical protein
MPALKDAAKAALTTLGALALIAVALWLTGSADKILAWFGPKIEFRSISRGQVSSFLAGEAIRFSLKGSSPDKVFWVFEETAPQSGSIESDHDFPFDSGKPQGIESARRVDVFLGRERRTEQQQFTSKSAMSKLPRRRSKVAQYRSL